MSVGLKRGGADRAAAAKQTSALDATTLCVSHIPFARQRGDRTDRKVALPVSRAGHDLAEVAGTEDSAAVSSSPGATVRCSTSMPASAKQRDDAGAGDAGKKGPVGFRRDDGCQSAVNEEQVRGRELRDIAVRIEDDRILVAGGSRFAQCARDIGIQRRGLGISRRGRGRRPAPLRQRGREPSNGGSGASNSVSAKADFSGTSSPRCRTPADECTDRRRPESDGCLRSQAHHFIDRSLELQSHALRRVVDTLAVRPQVGRHPMDRPRAVEDRRAEPDAVIHRAHQWHVAVVPHAFELGRVQERLRCQCMSERSRPIPRRSMKSLMKSSAGIGRANR